MILSYGFQLLPTMFYAEAEYKVLRVVKILCGNILQDGAVGVTGGLAALSIGDPTS